MFQSLEAQDLVEEFFRRSRHSPLQSIDIRKLVPDSIRFGIHEWIVAVAASRGAGVLDHRDDKRIAGPEIKDGLTRLWINDFECGRYAESCDSTA